MTSSLQPEVSGAATPSRRKPSWLNLLTLLPWMLFIIYAIYVWRLDRAIAARQQSTPGTITAHEPSNHDRYGYVYSIDGKAYHGWEIPQKTEYKIGEQVNVYYDPTDPTRSSLAGFEELSLREFGPVPFLLLGTAVIVFIFYKRRKLGNVPN